MPIISCAWEQRKFLSMTKTYSGLTYSPDDISDDGTLVLRSSNVQNGSIVHADDVYVNNKVANSKNVEIRDVIVVVRNGSRNLIGKHALINKKMKNTVIGAFMTGLRGQNGKFINVLLDTNEFKREIQKSLGATINQITGKDFKMMRFDVPKNTEEEKIGEVFDRINKVIAANQSKLDQFKELKKLLMEKIFSQQWRFKGFTDPWEQRKFGEVIVLVGGGTPAKNNFKYWNGDISWLSSQEIKSKYIGSSTYYITKEGLDNSSARLISPGRLLIVVRSGILARRFPISISTEYVAINQDIKALIFDEKKIVLDFMFSQLQYLEPFILRSIVKSGTTVQSVNLPDFKKMIIEIPLISEQKTIGQLFKIFDDLIAANQRRLDQLKALKKYLMQNMFV